MVELVEKSRYGCEVEGCPAHPKDGFAIFRTSPHGEDFKGKCKAHLEIDALSAQLTEALRIAVEALQFYAEVKNWNGTYHLAGIQSSRLDSGKKSREALSQIDPIYKLLEKK